jgi:hypothetical protein
MNIQVAVLCDAAADYNGKLSLLGTIDMIYTPKLPTVYPQCAIALRVAFDRIEEGQHKLRVSFMDEDGKSILPNMDAPVSVDFPPEATFLTRNFVIGIQHLKFEKPGLYSIDVALDGRQLTSIPLVVRIIPPQAQPPQPLQ